MRTLQEKYNGVNEGAFSKDQFLRDARLQLPNLVTRFNGYDDAVKILKNRGMIQETVAEENEGKPSRLDPQTVLNSSDEEFADILDNLGGEEILQIFQGLSADVVKSMKRVASTVFNKMKNLQEATRITNKSLPDYRYKVTNSMDRYPYEQILRGLRVELEGLKVTGTPTAEEYQKALAKVLKNLEKDSIFYTNQIAGINKKVDNHDQMIDVKKDNAVDKFNGLKKAQLKEGFKKLIKNILKENSEISGLYGDKEKYEREEKYGSYEEPEEDVYKMYGEDEADDVPYPIGHEEASDEEKFEDLFETDEESDDDKLARYKKYKYTLDGKEVSPKIAYFNNYIGADLDGKVHRVGSPDKDGVVQLKVPQGKTGMYTEDIFETVSLKDLL